MSPQIVKGEFDLVTLNQRLNEILSEIDVQNYTHVVFELICFSMRENHLNENG